MYLPLMTSINILEFFANVRLSDLFRKRLFNSEIVNIFYVSIKLFSRSCWNSVFPKRSFIMCITLEYFKIIYEIHWILQQQQHENNDF